MPDRTCGNCSADIAHRRSNARHCSDHCKRLASEARRRADGRLRAQWTKGNAARRVPDRIDICATCGVEFEHRRANRRCCSRRCARVVADAARYARKRGAFVENVDPAVVFERDGWMCGLCTEPIPREARCPDPLSASIDHVTPLARGGRHEYANVQAAHLGCNVVKGARVPISA